jgi:hypothetical protein
MGRGETPRGVEELACGLSADVDTERLDDASREAYAVRYGL